MKEKVFAHCTSIYALDLDFFNEYPIKALVIDRDNTLDSYEALSPSQEALDLISEIQKRGIRVLVVSNNVKKIIEPYGEKLGVPCLASSQKFSGKRILAFLKENGLEVKDCIFVGDQIFTDRIYTNKIKGRLILTEPLYQKDHFVTRFVRWLDKSIRRRWRKKNQLGLACPEKKGDKNAL
ncbi:MAG: hypothetical protein IJ194_08295 [Bacilli bacterium]|nr:hypothetical protein [Bacilli bacterium]